MRLQLILAALVLGALAGRARAQDAEHPTEVGVDTLVYTDTDNVIVSSTTAGAQAKLDDDGSEVHASALVDAVTAASVDVITEATPRFTEVREEADVGGSWAHGTWIPSARYRFSHEPDYLSNGAGLRLQHRLGTDTTIDGGYDLTYDLVSRSGTPLAIFQRTLVTHAADLSLSQVIDDKTVVRVAYSLTAQSGYLEKPYRYVPLFDAAGVAAASADGMTLGLDTFGRYRLPERPAEEVPDLRLRNALAVRAVRWVDLIGGAIRGDYRLYLDDWGIRSHTGELSVRRERDRREWSLTERLYEQTAADFWRRTYVVEDGAIPRYRTVDRDLSHFVANTAELGFHDQYDRWSWYATAGVMYTKYFDYLFLDHRFAILAGAGVKVDL
ncbi:MAG TPA: DUF3570 domain-containing protein [Kofleriaceae bacterium]|nr:DUF3570 domain-containing protein [Kofleriaceae bacterium]